MWSGIGGNNEECWENYVLDCMKELEQFYGSCD